MNVDYPAIGRRIKARRKAQRKTQENLAEALQVSVGYISQLERGVTKVNLDTLAEIAVELGCDLSELVTGVTGPHERYLDWELAERCRRMTPRQRQMLLELADPVLKY